MNASGNVELFDLLIANIQ